MESVQERMQRLGTKNKIAYFIAKEKEPYEFKRRYARIRAEEFARECDGRELNYHVYSCMCVSIAERSIKTKMSARNVRVTIGLRWKSMI